EAPKALSEAGTRMDPKGVPTGPSKMLHQTGHPLLFFRRTLMRTMLVGAVMPLACLSGAARADEASAVKAVENLGGKVTRDDKLPGKPVIGVNLPATKVTDAGLKELKDLKQLTSLNLSDTDGGGEGADEGLEELK